MFGFMNIKKWLKEVRDSISQKCMIKREISIKIKKG